MPKLSLEDLQRIASKVLGQGGATQMASLIQKSQQSELTTEEKMQLIDSYTSLLDAAAQRAILNNDPDTLNKINEMYQSLLGLEQLYVLKEVFSAE